MTNKEYSEIQRLIGVIEGATYGIKDKEIRELILETINVIDNNISKCVNDDYRPNVYPKEK